MPGSHAVEVELTQIRIRSTGECAHPLPAFRESGAGKVKRWGLGLRLDGGEWVDVAPVAGTLLVNIGDVLKVPSF